MANAIPQAWFSMSCQPAGQDLSRGSEVIGWVRFEDNAFSEGDELRWKKLEGVLAH